MNVSSLLPGLPDEKGRIQILHIHTTKMRQYDLLHSDVDIKELAVETKNYSGAELEGLVRAAQSTAMNRHIKVRYLTCYCSQLSSTVRLERSSVRKRSMRISQSSRGLQEAVRPKRYSDNGHIKNSTSSNLKSFCH